MSEAQIMAAGDKDKGMVRQANEDDFYISQPGRNVDPEQVETHGHLYIVADGVGGNRGGDRASEIATTLIPRYYYASNEADVADKLRQAIGTTAREILNEAGMHPERGNMSCTVAAAVIVGSRLTVAHLGDTRVYVLRKSGLQLLTRDHTWVQEQVDAGTLSETEAKRHPNRNVITKSLGSPNLPEPTLHNVRLQEGDRLLLCTDGLSEVVNDAEKADVLKKQPKLGAAVTNLIQLANARGGPDNIAVVTVQYGKGAMAVPVAARKWLMPLILLFLAVALFFVWNDSRQRLSDPTATVVIAGDETLVPEAATITPDGTTIISALLPTSTLANGDLELTPNIENGENEAPVSTPSEQPSEVETAAPPTITAASPIVSSVPLDLSPTSAPTTQTGTSFQIIGFHCGESMRSFGRNANIEFSWIWNGQVKGEEYLEIRISPFKDRANFTADPQRVDGNTWNEIVSVVDFAVDDHSDYRWQVFYMTREQDGSVPISSSGAGCFRLEEKVDGGESGPEDPRD